MINEEMKEYGFVEGTAFEGLMPKTMEILGDDYCIGVNDNQPVVHSFDVRGKGHDQMKVVSPYDIMIGDSANGSTEPVSGSTCGE